MSSTTPNDSEPVRVIGKGAPVLSMCPAKERSLMGPGEFLLNKDVRCDDGLPKWRRKDAAVLAKPSWANAELPLGKQDIALNGERYVAAAFKDGVKVRIALAPSSLDRWVDICGGGTNQWGGVAGDPRLTNTSAPVNFEVVKTPRYLRSGQVEASRDVLVINNLEDEVLVFDRMRLIGSRNVSTVTNNAGTIRVTTTANHDLATGDVVWIENVGGVTAANGLWNVTRISATVFDLLGSTFAGVYTAGGTVAVPFLGIHKDPTVPDGEASPVAYAHLSQFLGVSVHSGVTRTYAAAGVVNQNNRFELQESSASPYTGNSATMEALIGTTVAANDIATGQFSASFGLLGKHLILLLEGAYVQTFLKSVKLEINQDNAAYGGIVSGWVEVYNPQSTDPLKRGFISIQEDATNNRWLIGIPATNVSRAAGDRTGYHIRWTWLGTTPAPTVAQTIYFLLIGSAASLADYDNGFPGGTTWEVSIENNYSWSESPIYACDASALDISQMGGPPIVKDGTSSKAAPLLPIDTRLAYDYRIIARNSNGATSISGGLNGEPSHLNLYIRLPGGTKSYFALAQPLYDPGFSGATRVWGKVFTSDINVNFNTSATAFYRLEFANSNREAPSEFQQCIPKSGRMIYNGDRLICGALKERSGQYDLGGVMVSWERNPFRFQQVQEDERRGTYFQIAQERIQAFLASGSSAFGAGRTFLWTDKQFYAIGDPSPFAVNLQNVSDLSRAVPIGKHGTLSPLSVCQGYMHVYWVDQDAQWMRFGPDGLTNIGKWRVHNRLEMMPTNRKERICACFRGDRVYLGYTPALETDNNRALIWNERMVAVEAEDYPIGKFEHAFIYNTAAGSVSLSRLFFFNTDGSMRGHEEDSTGTIAGRLATGEFSFDEWDQWFIEEVQAAFSQNASGSISISRVSRRWGPDEAWTSTLSTDETGADYATYRDSEIHTKVGPEQTEEDRAWFLDLSGELAPGTQLISLSFLAKPSGTSSGKRN